MRSHTARAAHAPPGLGLALVAAFARMHGATIDLGYNAPGLRARLRFLPAAA